MAHLQLENYQAALDDFNIALNLEPELENVYFFRGPNIKHMRETLSYLILGSDFSKR
jgi:lipoprotein NlpI